MPKVTQEYRDARRDEIVSAAMRAFAEKGVLNASMADIIAETGLSAGAFYGHFSSKQELILEVARRATPNRVAEIIDLTSREELPEPGDVLRTILTGLAVDVAGDTHLLVQVWGMAMVDDSVRAMALQVFGDLREAYRSYLTTWATRRLGLSGNAADEWAEQRLALMLGLGQGYILQSALMPDFDGEQYFRAASDLLSR